MSLDDPVAIVRSPGAADVVASWPDLDVGSRATSSTVLGAHAGAWVFYRPLESEDPSLPAGHSAAVHVAVDGEVTRFAPVPQGQTLGVTRHGLWLTSGGFPDPDEEAAWRADHRVAVLGPDGIERRHAIDRRIAVALDDSGSSRLILYRGAPAARRDGFGGATYSYRYVTARLPDVLLGVMRVADLETETFDERELMSAMAAVTPRPPDDPPSDPAIRWDPISLTSDEKDAAVASVVHEFDHLTDYWRGQDGRTFPLSRGLGDPLVEAVDEWPRTRVEVSFTHPHYPEGRLRRTLRVFDDAGRVNPALYASIHLMEDLGTEALPDAGAARDGILDI